MIKNIIIAFLSISCAWILWELHTREDAPKAQYQLKLYQDHFDLMDGDRLVKSLQWENNQELDSVLQEDNL